MSQILQVCIIIAIYMLEQFHLTYKTSFYIKNFSFYGKNFGQNLRYLLYENLSWENDKYLTKKLLTLQVLLNCTFLC